MLPNFVHDVIFKHGVIKPRMYLDDAVVASIVLMGRQGPIGAGPKCFPSHVGIHERRLQIIRASKDNGQIIAHDGGHDHDLGTVLRCVSVPVTLQVGENLSARNLGAVLVEAGRKGEISGLNVVAHGGFIGFVAKEVYQKRQFGHFLRVGKAGKGLGNMVLLDLQRRRRGGRIERRRA